MFSTESPHRGDSIEYTQHTISNINRKSSKFIPNKMSAATVWFLLGTQDRVRNSRGKRAVSIRATEVLLYLDFSFIIWPKMYI